MIKTQLNKLSLMVIGFYAWMTAVFFGANMLDSMYFRAMVGRLDDSQRITASAAISDGLLLFGALMILAAFAAIAFSWKSSHARALLIASLGMGIFLFLAPMIFTQLGSNSPGPDIGAWLRVILCGSNTALAFLGLYNFSWQLFMVR